MIPGLEQLVLHCAPNVAAPTMMAIVRVESGGNPLALNVNGNRRLARQPYSRGEAIAWSDWLIRNGYSVDLGLAQINSGNLRRLGMTHEQMFDPCLNLRAGARILTENYVEASQKYGAGQTALRASISAYNTGNHRDGFANGYVSKVVASGGVAKAPAWSEAGATATAMKPRLVLRQNLRLQTSSAYKSREILYFGKRAGIARDVAPRRPQVVWVARRA